jgi:hypothetical protein
MSKKLRFLLIPLFLLLIDWGALSGLGQEEQPQRFQLLIVDETKSFVASMGVELFARTVRRTGLFDLSAKIVDVDSSFANPLQGEEPDRRYDVIVIVPRGIDDDSIREIWIATRPFSEISGELRNAVALIKEIVNRVPQARIRAVDVTEDLIPGFFATVFIREGWL